jgi:hypothetical protein
MKGVKSLKPKPRRSWNWAKNAPLVEVIPKVARNEDDSKPARTLFLIKLAAI